MSTRRSRGSKQAYRVIHQPVSRGLAVFAGAWLSGWLAEISADLRALLFYGVLTLSDQRGGDFL